MIKHSSQVSKKSSKPTNQHLSKHITEDKFDLLFKKDKKLKLYGGKIELSKAQFRRPHSAFKAKSDCPYKSYGSASPFEAPSNRLAAVSSGLFTPKLIKTAGNTIMNMKSYISEGLCQKPYYICSKDLIFNLSRKPCNKVKSQLKSTSPRKCRANKRNNCSLQKVFTEEVDKLLHFSKL